MLRTKNVGGGDDNHDRWPPPSSGRDKGKAMHIESARKCKHGDRGAQVVARVTAAAEAAERGGSDCAIHIGGVRVSLASP